MIWLAKIDSVTAFQTAIWFSNLSTWGTFQPPAPKSFTFPKVTHILLPIKRTVFLSLPLNPPASQRTGLFCPLLCPSCLGQGRHRVLNKRGLAEWMNERTKTCTYFSSFLPETPMQAPQCSLALPVSCLTYKLSIAQMAYSMTYIFNEEN